MLGHPADALTVTRKTGPSRLTSIRLCAAVPYPAMARRSRKDIMSTLFSSDPPMDEWLASVDMLRPSGSVFSQVREVYAQTRGYRAIVLDGSGRRDQLAAALISRRRPRQTIVIADATWKSEHTQLDRTVNRLGIRAIDSSYVTYCVLSCFEVESFQRTWGPLNGHVRFVPWPYTLRPVQLAEPALENGRVFAGGNSLRDYGTLIEIAGALDAPLDIATSVLTSEEVERLPANVTAGPVAEAEFDRMLREASVVVVPLQARGDRSSGQTVYVNAMARGKAVVVTDTPGVRDYIEDGVTGLIVPQRDPGAMLSALRGLLHDPQERRRLGRQARDHTLAHRSLTHYARHLLTLVAEALERDEARATRC